MTVDDGRNDDGRNDGGGMDEATARARMLRGTAARSVVVESRRQDVLDTAGILQARRSEIAANLIAGRRADAEVIGVGPEAVHLWLAESSMTWREVRSTRRAAPVAQLRSSLSMNRLRASQGVRLTTIYEASGLDANARLIVGNESLGTYLLGAVPVQMSIVDRRFALLSGPDIDDQMTVMQVTDRACLAAAERYWRAVEASVVPFPEHPRLAPLTRRQRQVVALLSAELNDEAIAESLEVSVRTIRSDIAQILDTLGVRSRFAAGERLKLWEHLSDGGDTP